jgi:hypothetical protein
MASHNVVILDQLEGSGSLSTALGNVFREWIDCSPTILKSVSDIVYLLRNCDEYWNAPLVLLSPRNGEALEQEVFRLHCILRQSFRNEAQSWIGGMIVMPCKHDELKPLARSLIYDNLSGHAVLSFPVFLVELLSSFDGIGQLYPHAWALAAERGGLVSFWQSLGSASTNLDHRDFPAAARDIKAATREVLENGVLARFLPHSDVIRRVESLNRKLDSLDPISGPEILKIINGLHEIMRDYQI